MKKWKKNHSRQWTTGYEVKKKSTNTTPINLGTPTNNLFWHFLFPFRNCSPRIRHAPCSPVYVVGNRVRVVVRATYETMSLPLRSLPPLTSLLLDMPLNAYLANSPSRALSLPFLHPLSLFGNHFSTTSHYASPLSSSFSSFFYPI